MKRGLALSFFAGLAALAPLAGCESNQTCILIGLPSVEVTVVDASGVAQPDAKVTYSIDGGAEQEADCASPPASGDGCGSWGAGVSEPGTFTVKAASADGTKHAQDTVTVEEGKCNVVTEHMKLTLK